MAHATLTHDIPSRRIESLSPGLRIAIPALIIIGAIAFAAALMVDAPRAWRAYHFNWLYFTTIAQGAVILAVVVSIAKGMWSRPIRRIALAFSAFLPIAYLAVLPILFIGAEHIFPWIDHPVAGKDVWLNQPFMAARVLLGLGVLFTVSLVFAYTALRPDMEQLRPQYEQGIRAGVEVLGAIVHGTFDAGPQLLEDIVQSTAGRTWKRKPEATLASNTRSGTGSTPTTRGSDSSRSAVSRSTEARSMSEKSEVSPA